ncbi:hypothetical protein M569_03931 [Genlisea aurea]|uniref:BZIP domain-containing protein n=1 Tax=Genlisea aurea TaxID=192259 RepID=S8E509_9LAMI|nr:hypothetical protein M569_03931 [Genlisea aurea]
MGSSTTLNFGVGDTNRAAPRMPSFISQPPVSNPMGSESTAGQASTISDFGVLEQYLGFRIGEPTNVNRVPTFNPNVNRQTAAPAPQSNSPEKNIVSASSSFPGALLLGAAQSWKGPNANVAIYSSAPVAQNENWSESNMADSSSRTDTSTDADPDDKNQKFEAGQSAGLTASDSSNKSKEKTQDQKTLRRLAQNREAARKSRLRKKAYVQQLENSRLKLTQLEQELQRARQQGIFISSMRDQTNATNPNGAMSFDSEYARWLDEQNKHVNELRTAVNAHAGDTELRTIVDGVSAHFNDIFRVKGNAAKTDVFHILSGMWKTPAERCFLWIGGFRPSELLKLLVNQLENLTEQQVNGLYNLQQTSHQAEDALSQGMEALQQSLAETLADGSSPSSGPDGSSGNVGNYMGQMAMAMGKLGSLEGFLKQADNLRQQTLQQMHRILTTRQSARALLLISDYFSRLRALSSLWLARPRE